ncbi:MAG: hypothetical protein INQ03_21805 [Candidatus Heimdallarchaeota archaeon]|nr:hypothetical protein [Candidatus Heimdallarchaeota archaeon]
MERHYLCPHCGKFPERKTVRSYDDTHLGYLILAQFSLFSLLFFFLQIFRPLLVFAILILLAFISFKLLKEILIRIRSGMGSKVENGVFLIFPGVGLGFFIFAIFWVGSNPDIG